MIPRETIDRVFAAAKIDEVVGDYVTLTKRGANLIGLCPFHNEKTGSFTVSPSKGIYKCFGCGKSGHAIGFVMEIEQCSFVEAVKQVGRKYHIEVQERELSAEEQQRQDDRESMFVVNDFCNRWFQSQLWDTPDGQAIGLSYFRERGLRDDIIRKFQLGYSPEKGSPLAQALKQQGFVEKYIVNNPDTKIGTGVCGKSEDGRIYDRFRDRVMFPIHTVSGKTVAFAGRIMKKKDNVGKYVNSPESLVYSKSNELYGLFLAKQAISHYDLCYLVEGQMDVISMHQSGIENVVASGGTALTINQIRLIKRYTKNIIVLYDGDAAGIHAALRGIDMFLEEGFNVKVVLLPDGKDPDSFAQSRNASDFIEYIRSHQTDFIRFKVALLRDEAGDDPHKRAEMIETITQSIAQIPSMITRQVYIKDSADKLMINEQLLTRAVIRFRGRKAEEEKKKREQQEVMASFAEAAAQMPEQNVTQPAMSPKTGRLEENYRNLMQVIVRYGERALFVQADGLPVQAGEYILAQLTTDGIAAPNAVYQKIIDEYTAHRQEPAFVAEQFFKFHPDPAISSLAVELIADRYQLSQIYAKQSISENVVQEVKVDEDAEHLPELVTRLLLEIKLTVIELRLDEIEKQLKTDSDWELKKIQITTQSQLLEVRNAICRQLGNRVVVGEYDKHVIV